MWQRGRQLASMLLERQEESKIEHKTLPLLEDAIFSPTYQDAKGGKVDSDRAAVKRYVIETLGGWHRNEGDEDWGL